MVLLTRNSWSLRTGGIFAFDTGMRCSSLMRYWYVTITLELYMRVSQLQGPTHVRLGSVSKLKTSHVQYKKNDVKFWLSMLISTIRSRNMYHFDTKMFFSTQTGISRFYFWYIMGATKKICTFLSTKMLFRQKNGISTQKCFFDPRMLFQHKNIFSGTKDTFSTQKWYFDTQMVILNKRYFFDTKCFFDT